MAGNYYNPITKPGEQKPGNYPRVGPNYQKFGEQPGYFYDPVTDKYYSPERWNIITAQRKQEQDAANAINNPKKQPGLGQTLLPIAAVAGTGVLAKEAGESLWNSVKDIINETGKTAAETTSKVAAETGANVASGGANALPGSIESQSIAAGGNGLSTPVPQTRPIGPTEVANPDGSVVDANTGATVGSWTQTAAGGIQVIAGINQFQNGDKPGGLLNIGAGGAQIGAGIYGPGSAAAGVSQVLGPIAGVYGGYKTAEMIGSAPAGGKRNIGGALGGAAAGAGVGAAFGGVGALPGAIIGGTLGALGSYFGSSKDKYQMMRDAARKTWQQNGIIDKDYKGTLADGTKFDFGKDGKGFGDVDFKDPLVQKIAALSNVIAAGEGATGKAGEGVANLYLRAAISNAGGDYNKALANIKHFAAQRGFNSANVQAQLDALYKDKQITDDQYKVWSGDKNIIFGSTGTQPSPKTGQPQVQQPQVQQQQPAQQTNSTTGTQATTQQQALQQVAGQNTQPVNNRSANMNTYQTNINTVPQQPKGPINPITGQPILPDLTPGGLLSIGQQNNTAPQSMVNYGANVSAQPRVNGQPQQPQQPVVNNGQNPVIGNIAQSSDGTLVGVPQSGQQLATMFKPNFGGKTTQQIQADLKAQQDAIKAQQQEVKRQEELKKQQEQIAKQQQVKQRSALLGIGAQ